MSKGVGNCRTLLIVLTSFPTLKIGALCKTRRIISPLTFISPYYTCNLLLYGNPKYDDYTN